jgi:seryl-tRNA synthetase
MNRGSGRNAATMDSGTTAPLPGADANLNKPPQRWPRMFISYSALVQKETSTKAEQKSQNMDATTVVSTISGTSEKGPVFEGIDDLKRKLAEIDAERNRYSIQQQKVEDDVSTLTQSMHKMASDIIDIHKDMNGLSTKMKEITDIQKKKMKQVETNMITSPPRKRRTGKKRSGSVSSNEETRLTRASDCDSDMNFERERGEIRTAITDGDGDSDMGSGSAGAGSYKWVTHTQWAGPRWLLPRCKLHWITGTMSSCSDIAG